MSWRPRHRSWGWATEVNRFTVVYDACILYPAPLRDLLMRLALTDLYRARWSDQIHEEWINAVLRNRPDLSRAQLERTRSLMNAHVLASYGLGACHPDLFLVDQLNLDAERVCMAMRQHRATLRNPPKSVEQYLVTLEEQGLSKFSEAVRHYAAEL